MPVSNEYRIYVLEQMELLPDIRSRKMFGGYGLYCGELFFGLLSDDLLYFKVDDSNRQLYKSREMGPFMIRGGESSMSYYEVPAEVLEDTAELACWANLSVDIAASSGS